MGSPLVSGGAGGRLETLEMHGSVATSLHGELLHVLRPWAQIWTSFRVPQPESGPPAKAHWHPQTPLPLPWSLPLLETCWR